MFWPAQRRSRRVRDSSPVWVSRAGSGWSGRQQGALNRRPGSGRLHCRHSSCTALLRFRPQLRTGWRAAAATVSDSVRQQIIEGRAGGGRQGLWRRRRRRSRGGGPRMARCGCRLPARSGRPGRGPGGGLRYGGGGAPARPLRGRLQLPPHPAQDGRHVRRAPAPAPLRPAAALPRQGPGGYDRKLLHLDSHENRTLRHSPLVQEMQLAQTLIRHYSRRRSGVNPTTVFARGYAGNETHVAC